MNTLDRYYAAQLVTMFVRSVLVLVGLFVFIDLMTNRRAEILEHDIPWTAIVQYYAYSIPNVISEYQVAAMSTLVAVLLVFGSSAQHGEITAMLAGGIGRRRIMRLPFTLALLLSILLFGFQEIIGYAATARALEVEDSYFSRARGARVGVSWAHLEGGWKCHIRKFNEIALTGEDVLIMADLPDSEVQIRAERIFWEESSQAWMIEGGTWSIFYPDSGMVVETRRITQERAPFSESPDDLFALADPSNTKSILALAQDIARAETLGMPSSGVKVDFHTKFARPVLCIIMVGIGMPFAIRIRRGGLAISLGAGLGIGLSYIVVFGLAQTLGYVDRLAPVTAAWLANGVFAIAALLLYRSTPT